MLQIGVLHREQGRPHEEATEETIKSSIAQYPGVSGWRCALALVYCDQGREAEARQEFAHLAAHDFADLPHDVTWLSSVCWLSEVCAFLGDAHRAGMLHTLLLPYARRAIVNGFWANTCYGSASRYLGLLATTMSRWEEAARHFDDALAMNAKMGARPFVAHTQHEYARMLLARGQSGDYERALELLDSALATAQELGMKSLSDKAKALREQTRGDRGPVVTAPEIGEVREPIPLTEENLFRREGEYWTLGYEGTTVRLKDTKGLHYIALLLREPGRKFHVIDLLAITNPQLPTTAAAANSGQMLEEQLTVHRVSALRSAKNRALFDPQARAAYRQRLDDLRGELEEAERFNDPSRAARLHGAEWRSTL